MKHDFGYGPVDAHKHKNGGGIVADTAIVNAGVWIGPKARVSGGTIRGGTIWGGTIWGGDIRGGTIRGGTIWGGTRTTKSPRAILGFMFPVTITDHHISVGCETHSPSHWRRCGARIIVDNSNYDTKKAKEFMQIINYIAKEHGCVDEANP